MNEHDEAASTPYADAAQHAAELNRLLTGWMEAGSVPSGAWSTVLSRENASAEAGILLPFAYICAVFSLRQPERLLLLCAWRGGVSLDAALTLAESSPEGALRETERLAQSQDTLSLLLQWGEDGLPDSPLALRPRIARYLADPIGGPLFHSELLWPEGLLPLGFADTTHQALLRARQLGGIVYLHGPKGSGKRTQARHLAAATHTPVLLADVRDAPLANDVTLECLLRGAIPCLTHAEAFEGDAYTMQRRVQALAEWFPFLLVFGEDSPPDWLEGARSIEMPAPNSSQRLSLWQEATDGVPLAEDVDLSALAGKFTMTPGQIHDATADALATAHMAGAPAIDGAGLHAACRRQLAVRLSGRARRVEPRSRWQDLVLPPQQKTLLRTAIDQVRYWQTVYGAWGLEQRIPYGRGLSMLFSGPPGTGKTMAAQVVAAELMMDLYQVDLSGVVSKYVGETEQNLRQVFDEVADAQGILFFDEADALFGKRTEVKDAQDRYANMEASYLLQRIEAYQGIVILATNIFQNFDDAFRRRIKFVVDFPFPDKPLREALWQGALPDTVPKGPDLDYRFLSRFELSGSYIRNISVNAAFLAAAEDRPLAMRHMLSALRIEMKKAGKALLKEDLGAYYYELEQEE